MNIVEALARTLMERRRSQAPWAAQISHGQALFGVLQGANYVRIAEAKLPSFWARCLMVMESAHTEKWKPGG